MNCDKTIIGKKVKLVYLLSDGKVDLDEMTDTEWKLLVEYECTLPIKKRPRVAYRDMLHGGLWVPVYRSNGIRYKLLQKNTFNRNL